MKPKKTLKLDGELVSQEVWRVMDEKGLSIGDLVSNSNKKLGTMTLHRLILNKVSTVQRTTVRNIAQALDMDFKITDDNGVKFTEKEKGGARDEEFTDFEKGLVLLVRTLDEDKQEIVFKMAETLKDSTKP